MEEIASRAEMSASLLYYYYKNKEELIMACLTFMEKELQRGLEERLARCRTATQKLNAWVDYLLPGEPQRAMWLFWLENRIQSLRHKKIAGLIRKRSIVWRRIREGILREGVAAGEFRIGNIHLVSEMFGGLIEGMALRYLSMDDGFLKTKQIAAILAMAIESMQKKLGPPPDNDKNS